MIEGLYIHIPFCHYKCPYCDFVSFVIDYKYEDYLKLLTEEIKLYRDFPFDLKTIYLGGGTPSIIPVSFYGRFFSEVSRILDLSKLEEITIECNPEDYSTEDYRALLDVGFNRVSIGVQSFTKKGLSSLGRKHSPKDCIKAIESAYSAGFENINVDLIFGYPNQSLEDIEKEIETLKNLPVKHVSFYLLTPYEDTMFGHMHREGRLSLPDDGHIERMFLHIHERMTSMGFEHYEISNYAKQGHECKHNLIYWRQREFLGVGVSAWSFVDGVRYGNTRNLGLYTQMVKEGKKPIAEWEKLEELELIKDAVFLGLRTKYGIPKDLIPCIPENLKDFFVETENSYRLSLKGMILLNEVVVSLFRFLENLNRRALLNKSQ